MTSSPLKSQVVSLELSKRLEELGVPQSSLFCWVVDKTNDEAYIKYGDSKSDWVVCYSAFLVGELGEMLPVYWQYSYQRTEGETIAYFDLEEVATGKTMHWWGNETEADARAKMLIYLLENNLLKTSDL